MSYWTGFRKRYPGEVRGRDPAASRRRPEGIAALTLREHAPLECGLSLTGALPKIAAPINDLAPGPDRRAEAGVSGVRAALRHKSSHPPLKVWRALTLLELRVQGQLHP